MTKIDEISVRLGIEALHELFEVVEEIAAVVGAWASFGVVLDTEGRNVGAANSLDRHVVQVDVRQLGSDTRKRLFGHRVIVVLRSDLDFVVGQTLHRMVSPVMPEGQLEGFRTDCGREQLVPETDAEDGHLAEQLADRAPQMAERLGVAWTVAQEDAVGVTTHDVFGRRSRRYNFDGAEALELVEDGALDTEVEGHDAAIALPLHGVGLVASDRGDEVDAVRAGLGLRRCEKRCLICGAKGSWHGARVSNVAGESSGVDPGDARKVLGDQIVVELALAAVVTRAAGRVANNDPSAKRTAGLGVVAIHAIVPDVWVGEGDDLPRVRRIGDHLLIAGHDRVEHHFTGTDTVWGIGADRLTLENGAILKHQQSFFDRH